MQITFTDAERAFADSAEGKMLVAREQCNHEMREAHKGSSARKWTDAMEGEAIRGWAMRSARSAVANAAKLADTQRQEPILRAQRDEALAQANDHNAWRRGR